MNIIEQCAADMAQPNAAMLVGAGASVDAGPPSWRNFLTQVAETLDPDMRAAVLRLLGQKRYIEAADVAEMGTNDRGLWRRNFERFDTGNSTTKCWNLLASMGLVKIVTTNWDGVAANAFASVWKSSAPEFIGHQHLMMSLNRSTPHICYPHGKWTNPDSIIFTRSQYLQAEQSDKYRQFWISLLTAAPLLIVAFSGEDPAFRGSIEYVVSKLEIQPSPWVICPKSMEHPSRLFGGGSRIIEYDDSQGHAPLHDLLRMLRDRIGELRADLEIDEDPFKRANVKEIGKGSEHELLLALSGIDLRRHCGTETLLGLVILLSEVGKGPATREQIAALTARKMLLAAPQAEQVTAAALEIGETYAWISFNGTEIRACDSLPRPDSAQLDALVDNVVARSQTPLAWSRNDRTDQYVRDALLGAVGFDSARAAESVLGLYGGGSISPDDLCFSLQKHRLAIGSPGVERQICEGAIALLSNPPKELEDVCGRLATFAFVTHAATLEEGRRLLKGHNAFNCLYLDANIALPILAQGHKWHTRCLALLHRCRKQFRRVLVLTGFLEELERQLNEARNASQSSRSTELFLVAAMAPVSANGFLDAYAVWAEDRYDAPTFEEYLSSIGLGVGHRLEEALGGAGIEVVRLPKATPKNEEMFYRFRSILSDEARAEVLVRHEAEQLMVLAHENRGPTLSSMFVTAHRSLLERVALRVRSVAPAVVPPVALANLLDCLRPTDVPLGTLRELAFEAPGLEVGQAVFSTLIRRWRNEEDKIKQLDSDEIKDLLRTEIEAAAERVGELAGIDKRMRLAEVIEERVVPRIEVAVAANAPGMKEKSPKLAALRRSSDLGPPRNRGRSRRGR